jgi:hypothetical protein
MFHAMIGKWVSTHGLSDDATVLSSCAPVGMELNNWAENIQIGKIPLALISNMFVIMMVVH